MFGKTKDSGRSCAIVAAGLVVVATSAAAAETVVLDFESGSQFTSDDRFDVGMEHLHWWGDGYATQGVMYAWNMEDAEAAVGRLSVTASEDFVIEGLSFQLAGYRDVASALSFEFYVDGQLQSVTEGLEFDGVETLYSIDLPRLSGSSFEIVLDNYLTPAFVGLDNVTFNITPAPGAMALLGLAGICGRRRRRA